MKGNNKEIANLDALIEKIKSEGIKEAQEKSEEIVREAQKRAAKIIEDAKERAEEISKEMEENIKQREEVSRKHLEQAARDTIISVKNSLISIFQNILREKISNVMKGNTLKEIIIKVIEEWYKNRGGSIEVLLSPSDKDAIKKALLSELSAKMKEGIEIKAHPDIESGFRIGIKNEHLYYDFTDESIAEALSAILTPELSELIDNAIKKQ